MSRILFALLFPLALVAITPTGLAAMESGARPLLVSPAGSDAPVIVLFSCPTFSWSAVEWAEGYEVAVFDSGDEALRSYEELALILTPRLVHRIDGRALSWTPGVSEALEPGRNYTWYVQAIDANGAGLWSPGGRFMVLATLTRMGSEQSLVAGSMQPVGTDLAPGNAESSANPPHSALGAIDSLVKGVTGTESGDTTFYGYLAGNGSMTGGGNSLFGGSAGHAITTGGVNTMVGYSAGANTQGGSHNTFLGSSAGMYNVSGDGNTFLGYVAGINATGSDNVFIGFAAGGNETGSNKLYIANTETSSPLVYGDFSLHLLRVNGNLQATGYLSLDAGATQIGAAELNLLDGKTLATGASNNDKLATQGYADDHSGLSGSGLTSAYLTRWNGSQLVNSLVTDNGATVSVGGNMQATGYFSLNGGTTQISSTELNLLDNMSLATGAANNAFFATKGYVDDHIAGAASALVTGLSNNAITKWDSGNGRLANSLLTEGPGVVSLTGKLGIGTSTPAYPLEIATTGANAQIVEKRSDGATVIVGAMGASGQVGTLSEHALNLMVNNMKRLTISPAGNVGLGVTAPVYPLQLTSGAHCTAGGVWTNASSRGLKENIEELGADEAEQTLSGLDPVKYNYKADRSDRHVGFIAEDVPDLVATSDRKGLSPMDIVAVLTRVVQGQQKTISEQERTIGELKALQQEIPGLLKRIRELEAAVRK